MTQSKKHHYNPQSILRRFSIDGRGKNVWIYDKKEGRSYRSSVQNAGAENHFNVVEVNGSRHNLEDVFQEVDSLGATSISRLHETRIVHGLSLEEAGALVAFVAAQILRVKMVRTSLVHTTEQLLRSVLGDELPSEEVTSAAMSDNTARVTSFRYILGEVRERIVSELVKKAVVLLAADSEQTPLWTSDNPVALFNPLATGLMGLASPGIQIFLPISSELCLTFFDPAPQVTGSGQSPQAAPKWNLSLQTQINSQEESGPIKLSPEQVAFLNRLQVGRSSRFLYSSQSDFSLAEEFVRRAPDAAEVDTLIAMGFPGRPKQFQQDKDYVALHGPKGSFELEVEDLAVEGGGFRFSCSDRILLEEMRSAAPFSQVQSYGRDGKSVGFSRATIEILPVVDGRGRPQARILHEDPALNRLMEKIDASSA